MSKALGIVITDGVGFRNFILSDFIQEAKEKFAKVYVLSCLPKEVYKDLNLNCEVIELDVFKEKFATWFFRKAKEVTHLQLHAEGNFGIQDNLRATYSKANNSRGIATRFLHKWSKRIHSEKWILRYNRWQQQTFKNNVITLQYKQLLKEKGIDMLFFTHQRPPYIAPLIFAAEQLKIKTAAFIFSWDNLASKGRMAGNFDYFMVWSQLMKDELLEFYDSVKENQIEIVGTPQFEPYVLDRYRSTKDEFFKKFNLDSTKMTLCFSCGDISTSKNDEMYIELIANAIINKKIQDVNLIVRTSPAEEPIRFDFLAKKFPFITWNYPKWRLARENHSERWSQRVPSSEDLKDLRAILEFSDLNVNVVSTMTLDFMLFDKPVIYPVFGTGDNGLYNDRRFMKYKHLVHVKESNAVRIATDENELIGAIKATISDPSEKLKFQRELVALEIGKPLNEANKSIVDSLLKWSNK